MHIDLSDAGQKLARAREHIAETDKRILELANPDLYRINIKPDPQAARVKIDIISLHEADKSLNCIIGDAVGNLRSVLDYIAVALVSPITGKPDGIGFPFANDVKGFVGEVTKASLAACSQATKDFFINEVQAYEGGRGHSLWVLNRIRNIEKHRFLLTTRDVAGVRSSWRVGTIMVTDGGAGVKAGDRGTFLDVPANVEFTDKIRPTFVVSLNEPPYVPNAPAVAFLNGIASDIERLLDALKVIV